MSVVFVWVASWEYLLFFIKQRKHISAAILYKGSVDSRSENMLPTLGWCMRGAPVLMLMSAMDYALTVILMSNWQFFFYRHRFCSGLTNNRLFQVPGVSLLGPRHSLMEPSILNKMHNILGTCISFGCDRGSQNRYTYIYWAKVLTEQPKTCDNFFVP